jgi:hypothetical protein
MVWLLSYQCKITSLICLSTRISCLQPWLSVYLSVYHDLSVSLSVRLSVFLLVRLSICLCCRACLTAGFSVGLFVYLSVLLGPCMFVFLFLCLSTFCLSVRYCPFSISPSLCCRHIFMPMLVSPACLSLTISHLRISLWPSQVCLSPWLYLWLPFQSVCLHASLFVWLPVIPFLPVLSACLADCIFAWQAAYLSVFLSACAAHDILWYVRYLSVRRSVSMYVCHLYVWRLSSRLSVFLSSVCMSLVCPSLCLPVSLSLCLPACLSVCVLVNSCLYALLLWFPACPSSCLALASHCLHAW